jgi:hypothetical protein
MKFLRLIVGFALFVILVAGAAYLVHAALTRDSWEQAIGIIRASRRQALEGAVVVLLLIALYLLTGIRRGKGEPFITFETEGGSVSISMKAIRDFLIRVGDEFAAVVSLDPAIRATSGSMEVELNLRVKAGTQIPELSKMLQERIRESIKDNLGLTDVRAIRISVREIVASPPEKKKQEKKADETVGDWEGSMRP